MASRFVLRLLVTVFVSSVVEANQDTNSTITLGIITAGEKEPSQTMYEYFDMNVKLRWEYINGQEISNIYSSLTKLDEDDAVDAIMLFSYDANLVRMIGSLGPGKTWVKWGEHVYNNAEVDALQPNITDSLQELNISGEDKVTPNTRSKMNSYCVRPERPNSLLSFATIPETVQDETPSLTRSYTETVEYIIPRGITNIVKHLKWKHVILFHDWSTEISAYQLIDLLSDAFVLMMVYNVEDVDVYDVLRSIYYKDVMDGAKRSFILLCGKHRTLQILHIANTFDSTTGTGTKTALSTFSRWLVTGYDHDQFLSENVARLASNLDNVLLLVVPRLASPSGEDFTAFLQSVLVDVRTRILLEEHIEDTKMAVIEGLQEIAETMNPLYGCMGLLLDTLMWTGPGSRGFSSVGHVDMAGDVVATSHLLPNTNYGYNKRYFSVSTLHYPTESEERFDANGTKYYVGICFDLLAELAKTLNFTYSVSKPKDRAWGVIVDKEKQLFNGLIGQLQRKEIDLVAASLTISAVRMRHIDYTYPFRYETGTVVYKKPDPNLLKWRTLLNPLKWEVLATIGGLAIAVSVICYLLEVHNPYYNVRGHLETSDYPERLHVWHTAFWCMYGVLFNQGSTHIPRSVSGRTLVCFWALASVAISATYCGNLIAFLTVNKVEPPFNTLEELLQTKGTFKWGYMPGTFYASAFATSRNPIFQKIAESVVEFNKTDPFVLDRTGGYKEKIKKGGYAYFSDRSLQERACARDCDLSIIKETFLPQEIAFGMPKHSPHTRIFSDQMMKIHESGLFELWKRKWWPKAQFCEKEKLVTDTTPVSLLDVQSAFYLCAGGVVLSCIAFVSELIVHYRKPKRNDHVTGSSCQTGNAISPNPVSPESEKSPSAFMSEIK